MRAETSFLPVHSARSAEHFPGSVRIHAVPGRLLPRNEFFLASPDLTGYHYS